MTGFLGRLVRRAAFALAASALLFGASAHAQNA